MIEEGRQPSSRLPDPPYPGRRQRRRGASTVTELQRALDAERALTREQAVAAGLIQHDLSNVLTRVSLSFSALGVAADEAERARWTHEVDRGLKVATEMLAGMRTTYVSSVAAPDPVRADFAAFLREAVEQRAGWEAGPRLELETPATLAADFSPTLMRPALLNLVRVAAAYAQQTWVRVRLAPVRDGWWQVTLANGGPGIPGNHRKYLPETCSLTRLAPHQPTSALGVYVARLCLRRQGLALRVRATGRVTVFAFALRRAAD